jgi:hypothetical protein
MSFKFIKADPDQHQSHDKVVKLVNRARYTPAIYGKLDEFFAKEGFKADADEAFIEGKRRERTESLHGLHVIGSWLLDFLSRYGRHPERVGYIGLGIVLLGCLLFAPNKMELQDVKELEKPEDKRRQYNRFWYSLGLFLPVVDLKTSELWGPKRRYRFLRNYVRVHILLGWVLVPTFLAAITGLIK